MPTSLSALSAIILLIELNGVIPKTNQILYSQDFFANKKGVLPTLISAAGAVFLLTELSGVISEFTLVRIRKNLLTRDSLRIVRLFTDLNDLIIANSQEGINVKFFVNNIEDQGRLSKPVKYKGHFLKL